MSIRLYCLGLSTTLFWVNYIYERIMKRKGNTFKMYCFLELQVTTQTCLLFYLRVKCCFGLDIVWVG